jgi:hypothetical protein
MEPMEELDLMVEMEYEEKLLENPRKKNHQVLIIDCWFKILTNFISITFSKTL